MMMIPTTPPRRHSPRALPPVRVTERAVVIVTAVTTVTTIVATVAETGMGREMVVPGTGTIGWAAMGRVRIPGDFGTATAGRR